MVFIITLLLQLLGPLNASASQLEESLGPQDPAYFQAIAPRFLIWAEKEFSKTTTSSPLQTEVVHIIQEQIKNLKTWDFTPFKSNFTWSRIQMGLRFENKKETDSYFSVFPDNVSTLHLQIKNAKFFKIPSQLNIESVIGIGFNFYNQDVYIYSQQALLKNLKQPELHTPQSTATLLLTKLHLNKKNSAQTLVKISPIKLEEFSLSPFVSQWSVWLGGDQARPIYDVTLTRFNTMMLESYAKNRIKQISSEFLLNTLRLQFRDKNDLSIIYP